MLTWGDLHKTLGGVSGRHARLADKFSEFARLVHDGVSQPSFHVKGITVSLHLDNGYFTASFAGLTVRFVLSSPLGPNSALQGVVKAYLERSFPETEFIELRSFTFTGSGQTNILDPESSDPLHLNHDLAAIHLALNVIHESLSK